MFHEKLKQIRLANDLSQIEISEIMGISVSTYNGYEQGKQFPKVDSIIPLCKKFNISADWLLGIESTTKIDTWGDLANAINDITFDYDLVFEAEIVDNNGNVHDTFTVVLIPYSWVSDFFAKKRQMKDLAKTMPELLKEWTKGALSEPPLTNEISKISLLEFISNLQWLYDEDGYRYYEIRIPLGQFNEVVLSPEEKKQIKENRPAEPETQQNDDDYPFDL
ncbi:MAG: helix-turn-helix transcriptional regulator [Clostridiaceae bacterium]|nr:helix-turn-helix transcriptional regulator [Clostridiaceae bacterium]